MSRQFRAQEDTVNHRQDAFTVFVRRDLARVFEMPIEMPFEMLTLIDEICGGEGPKGS